MSDDQRSKFSHWLIAFLLANEGISAIAFAITAPILIGMAGLGVEVGTWYVYNRRLQNAADVASIAAAVEVAYATDGTKNQSLANSIVPVEVARNGIPTAKLDSFDGQRAPNDRFTCRRQRRRRGHFESEIRPQLQFAILERRGHRTCPCSGDHCERRKFLCPRAP